MLDILKINLLKLSWSNTFKKFSLFTVLIILSNLITFPLILGGVQDVPFNVTGFIFNSFGSSDFSKEIIYTTLANTLFIVILTLVLGTNFLSNDHIESREQTLVANNYSPMKLFFGKYIVSSLFIISLYITTIFGSLILNMFRVSSVPTTEHLFLLLEQTFFISIILIIFLLFCSSLKILLKNNKTISILILIYMFAGEIIYLNFVAFQESASLASRLFCSSNFFVYFMKFAGINGTRFSLDLPIFMISIVMIITFLLKNHFKKNDYL